MAKYNIDDYNDIINKYATQYNLSPDLIKAVIKTESSGNPNAESGTGPVGLMQVSKALAKQYGYSNDDRLDPEKNIAMGARYLAENYKHFNGDIQKTLLGYNQGTAGAEKQLKTGSIAPEGLKYMANKNFTSFVNNQNVQDVANPMKRLNEGSESANQFNPALLQRNVGQAAPTQADAQASTITNSLNTVQQLNAQRDELRRQMREKADADHAIATGREPTSEEEGDKWQQLALGLTSAIFGNKDNTKTESASGVGAGQGASSNWSDTTSNALQNIRRFNVPSYPINQ